MTLSLLVTFLLFLSIIPHVKSFPNGAGHCSSGTAIANEAHGTLGSGTLGNGDYQVRVFNEEQDGDGQSKSLIPNGPNFLSTGVVYTVELVVSTDSTTATTNGFFRGFLFRLSGNNGENVKNAMVISPEYDAMGKNHTMCSSTVAGVTHTNNSDKTAIAVIMNMDEPVIAKLEVSVVRSNNPTGSNLWHYNSFQLVFQNTITSQSPTPAGCLDSSTFQFELDNNNIQDCAWLTKNAKRTEERIDSYCSRPHVRYACPGTCLESQGEACECLEDTPNFTFQDEITNESHGCDWLVEDEIEMDVRRETYCMPKNKDEASTVVGENCVRSCGFCEGVYPGYVISANSERPSPSPSARPSMVISVSPTGPTRNTDQPSSLPSISCADNATFQFELDNNNIQDCAWLTKNAKRTEERIDSYCSRPHVRYSCPATCLESQGEACECLEDTPNFTFQDEITNESHGCDWLVEDEIEMDVRRETYCMPKNKDEASTVVGENCVRSCGFCEGVYPGYVISPNSERPSPSPSARPTIVRSMNPTSASQYTNYPSSMMTSHPSMMLSARPSIFMSSVSPTGASQVTQKPSYLMTSHPSMKSSARPSISISNLPSNAPIISHSESPSSYVSLVCADDSTFEFVLDNGKKQDCAWLTKNSEKTDERISSYCPRLHVKYACPATCLEQLGQPCDCMDDNESYGFLIPNTANVQNCDWLVASKADVSDRQTTYCYTEDGKNSSDVGQNCVTSCGFCRGSFTNVSRKQWLQIGSDIDAEAYHDQFGSSVSISGDGTVIAVGAPYNDGSGSDSGHVRVYRWDEVNNRWSQLGEDIDGVSVGDAFGRSVSLSKNGRVVAVGAPGNAISQAGLVPRERGYVRVFVFDDDVNAWKQLGGDMNGENESDVSGSSVSLSDDGRTVAIGAPLNDAYGYFRGHVRVYRYSDIANVWSQLGSDIDGENDADGSGWSVSLSGDGLSVAIGAPFNGDNSYYTGHVRVYRWDDTNGDWLQVGDDIAGESYYDESGTSVSISDDGSVVAVGSPFSDGGDYYNGHVRVFRFDVTANAWMQLGPDINGESYYELSGWSVSLSGSGEVVAIGAPYNKESNFYYGGRVRVYRWNESIGVWRQVGADIDGESYYDESGSSVALSDDGKVLAVGSPTSLLNWKRNESGGHVRVFHLH